ncbi:DNA double-strand break repair nuclease NurA [Crocosphaera sp. UHCC 0190]|uniref:DNA double-strand break repair nuclease NurA n=1 Tax=Crocosphaera sp. UHCC 0190 TaxID=3110246 RepID=UPI002B21D9E3|nr:DNA double-strand break repair nuclease NurA [Crocosphaera sp. UHCC 0190]MEA5509784.1 DNA double-strand break repair nuclease NurA [Crocosphaera sp. UHCC 0190]
MLDIAKLAGKIPGISQHFKQEMTASYQRLEQAQIILQETQKRQEELIEQYKTWRDRLIFSAAIPIEPLDTRLSIPAPPNSHSVFATDGSQIAPSHHEIAYCYLINVGRVMLHYGQNLHPLLDSLPEVYYRPEDLYVSKQWGIRTEEWLGYRRTVLEAQLLSEMACGWVKPPGAHYQPNLAMVDGSLVYWFLDGLAHDARDLILPPIQEAWEQLRAARIPLMGYLSASRSVEGVNFLRLHSCTFDTPNCVVNCMNLGEKKAPCQIIEPLRDTNLWGQNLEPGERGPLWQSSARILDLYSEPQRIYFCYVNVGTEIARVEFPAWVVEDEALLNQALGIMLAQVSKGYGYPVALAESHNQAVIRGGDRVRFFALLEQQMIRVGLQNVGTSYKEARKRGSIA